MRRTYNIQITLEGDELPSTSLDTEEGAGNMNDLIAEALGSYFDRRRIDLTINRISAIDLDPIIPGLSRAEHELMKKDPRQFRISVIKMVRERLCISLSEAKHLVAEAYPVKGLFGKSRRLEKK